MAAAASTSDEDTFGHFQMKQQAWQIERRHLQLQMERVRQQQLAKERKKKAGVAQKAKKLASDWKVEDALLRDNARVQKSIGATEHAERLLKEEIRQKEVKLLHGIDVQTHLANREMVEDRFVRQDAELARRGEQQWARGMRAGAEEVALEKLERDRFRRTSNREFAWAKEDVVADTEVRKVTGRPLPTGPGAIEHRQTPARTWRVESLTMSPAAWTNSPTDATVERAKTAQMRSHRQKTTAYEQRRAHVTSTLDAWGDVGVRVGDAKYAAWRHKVDAVHSPRNPGWPDKSTHRIIGVPADSISPVNTPRRSPRR